MKASTEFKVGNHDIGYISPTFEREFGSTSFNKRPTPKFQKLPRAMNDATIESELKPGMCELGDILASLKDAPKECKDGRANLFYFPAFVVGVRWRAGARFWGVDAWRRVGYEWSGGGRVFSPATGALISASSDLESSETLSLGKAIELVKAEGYKIFREI